MSLNARVVDYLGQVRNEEGELRDKIVLEMPLQPEYNGNPTKESITIAHDYVRFSGIMSIQQTRKEDGSYPVLKTRGATNWIHGTGDITISIRDMYDVILPMLNKHKYLQAAHFKTRNEGTDEAYPPYACEACILQYFDDKSNQYMVTFRRRGEIVWETVTLKTFNVIQDSLKLSYTKKELIK